MNIDPISSPLITPVTPVQSSGFNTDSRAHTPEDLAKQYAAANKDAGQRSASGQGKIVSRPFPDTREADRQIQESLLEALRDGKDPVRVKAYLLVSAL